MKHLAIPMFAVFLVVQSAAAQVVPSDRDAQLNRALAQIELLATIVATQEARIEQLEAFRQEPSAQSGEVKTIPVAFTLAPPSPITAIPMAAMPAVAMPETSAPIATQDVAPAASRNQAAGSMDAPDPHDHMINLPAGGPALKIRGFFDFNFGVGSIANPLIYPVSDNGCGTCGNPVLAPHTGFQAGEFDLFISSKLSDRLSFISEVVLGPDDGNDFDVDIERYQLTYRANRYLSVSAGRFHTSIGYYNTAYHHGNWFSTAEGRPIMYLFEDNGGVLPVHMVGLNAAGEVPHTEYLGLHWIAEVGNGHSSNPNVAESVQNFYTDRNYKATNLAFFMRPQFLAGLQIGGSWYHDGLNPSQAQNPLPIAEVRQNIESAYVVYFSSNWEFMNEGVLEGNRVQGALQATRSPMAYTQLARKFGIYKPYFRYQYVRDSLSDPLNLLRGKYYGPSAGIRVDLFDYAAFKLQFNHLYQSSQLAGNGLDAQLAFTF